jgi:hypothetical protein
MKTLNKNHPIINSVKRRINSNCLFFESGNINEPFVESLCKESFIYYVFPYFTEYKPKEIAIPIKKYALASVLKKIESSGLTNSLNGLKIATIGDNELLVFERNSPWLAHYILTDILVMIVRERGRYNRRYKSICAEPEFFDFVVKNVQLVADYLKNNKTSVMKGHFLTTLNGKSNIKKYLYEAYKNLDTRKIKSSV